MVHWYLSKHDLSSGGEDPTVDIIASILSANIVYNKPTRSTTTKVVRTYNKPRSTTPPIKSYNRPTYNNNKKES